MAHLPPTSTKNIRTYIQQLQQKLKLTLQIKIKQITTQLINGYGKYVQTCLCAIHEFSNEKST